MAVELLLAFALKSPPSGASLQEALDREPDPIQITDPGSVDLQKHNGFLPVKYKAVSTGFSVYQSTPRELETTYPETRSVRPTIRAVLSFQFGGNPWECVSVMHTASVLVTSFGARAFDPESKTFVSAGNLKTIARLCEDQASGPDAAPLAPAKPGQ